MPRWTTVLVCGGLLLVGEVHAQPLRSGEPPTAEALQQRIDRLDSNIHTDEDAFRSFKDEFHRFEKGEGDRVAQDTQQTLGWFNTIATVGGGIVSFVGITMTLIVIGFSLYTARTAIDMAQRQTKEHLDKNQESLDKHLAEVRAGITAINEAKQVIAHEVQYARKAHHEIENIFERLRDPDERLGALLEAAGAPDPVGSRGVQSALDTYNGLIRHATHNLDKAKYTEAFRDLQDAEQAAPTRELVLQAIDAQAVVLSARGAGNEAIGLLEEKLAPLRNAHPDRSLPDAVKFQIARMLIRLGLLYKGPTPINAIRAYDDACRLVEQSDEPVALVIYASSQINKAQRQMQAGRYAEAVACYRCVQRRLRRNAALRSLLADAIFREGGAIQDEAMILYDGRKTNGKQDDWRVGFRSAIVCFEQLLEFAKDNDASCRLFCAEGLINAGALHGMLAEEVPEERDVAIACLGRVVQLFEHDANSDLQERVEKARFLRARLAGEADA